VLNFLHEQSCGLSAQALFSWKPGERRVHFGEAVSGTTGILTTRGGERSEATSMVYVIWQKCRYQDGTVEEPSHRRFFRRETRTGPLPRKLSSRSRRICRSIPSVASAEIGSPVLKTQMPCFLRSPDSPLRGRSTMRSSELSSSRESPARSCISSRTGFGKTTRPALSTVSVVFIMALYHSICHPEWHSMITPPSRPFRLRTAGLRKRKTGDFSPVFSDRR